MSIKGNFEFRAIGQGCFYTGSVHQAGKAPFHFVYDCGTYSRHRRLEEEIDLFKQQVNYSLDLLIISHFDNDHVNKVVSLLTKPFRCDRLIIPYYDSVDRLRLCTATEDAGDEYLAMLRDPVSYFRQFDVGEIIVVGRPDDDGYLGNAVPVILPPTTGGLPSDNGPGDNLPVTEYYDRERSVAWSTSLPAGDQGDKTKIKFVVIPYRMVIGPSVWQFVFYLKKGDQPGLVLQFNAAVEELISEYGSVYALFEGKALKQLKEQYKTVIQDSMNNTSLVTFHGPAFIVTDSDCFLSDYMQKKLTAFGTLLTGDINISGKIELEKMEQYFKNYWKEIVFFQTPHHGSKNNWPFRAKAHQLHQFAYYIINHGLGRSHHPGPEVIADIQDKAEDAIIQLNNELSGFHYCFQCQSHLEATTAVGLPKALDPMTFRKINRTNEGNS